MHAWVLGLVVGAGCGSKGTEPPPDGWSNVAPAVVQQAHPDGAGAQLLQVQEARWSFWVRVPDVGAAAGDHVLLGRGTARHDVPGPGGARLPEVLDIAHVAVVDAETAAAVLRAEAPADAVPVGTVWAERTARDGQSVRVHGSIVKASPGILGTNYYHLQDGSGDAGAGTHDVLVQSDERFAVGQRVTVRATVAADADLGMGYRYAVMLKGAVSEASKAP
jgi:hypothetical protein